MRFPLRNLLNSVQSLFKTSSRNNVNYFTYVTEPSQVIQCKEPKWVTAEEAFADLQSNDIVTTQGAAATPTELLCGMTAVGKNKCLQNVKVYHMHTDGDLPHVDPNLDGIFRDVSFFIGGKSRKPIAEGRADVIPIFLSEIPLLFHRKLIQPNIACIHVTPPDNHGFCSLGTSVDCVRAAMSAAKIIVALVNCQMPRTFGDAIVHISHIDYAVEVDRPLHQHTDGPPSKQEQQIGKYIAENLVEDGATLQMGIGSLPDAVLSCLPNHKNLGIHSEMFSDGVIPLVEQGCVTNNEKPIHKGRIVGSFLNGSQKLYDFIDDNPLIEMMVVDYVNNNNIIKIHPKMTAINAAIEVDLTGQICADSIGTRMYSGFGGQLDFLRGAAEGKDGRGKPIVAMVSTTKKGETKIVPTLKVGAGVVTTRGHVHYVVTEYGIAFLFGKTLRQRAYALINIAHPDHRQKLEEAAFNRLKAMPCP